MVRPESCISEKAPRPSNACDQCDTAGWCRYGKDRKRMMVQQWKREVVEEVHQSDAAVAGVVAPQDLSRKG